jgi:hypothetical protein
LVTVTTLVRDSVLESYTTASVSKPDCVAARLPTVTDAVVDTPGAVQFAWAMLVPARVRKRANASVSIRLGERMRRARRWKDDIAQAWIPSMTMPKFVAERPWALLGAESASATERQRTTDPPTGTVVPRLALTGVVALRSALQVGTDPAVQTAALATTASPIVSEGDRSVIAAALVGGVSDTIRRARGTFPVLVTVAAPDTVSPGDIPAVERLTGETVRVAVPDWSVPADIGAFELRKAYDPPTPRTARQLAVTRVTIATAMERTDTALRRREMHLLAARAAQA